MTTALLLALGIPVADRVVSTILLLRGHKTRPPVLLRLGTRRPIAWNTRVGLLFGLGVVRWAFSR